MTKLPLMTAKELAKVLTNFEHSDGRTTVVPNHPSEEIDRGLLNKIIKHDLQISREEFLKRL